MAKQYDRLLALSDQPNITIWAVDDRSAIIRE